MVSKVVRTSPNNLAPIHSGTLNSQNTNTTTQNGVIVDKLNPLNPNSNTNPNNTDPNTVLQGPNDTVVITDNNDNFREFIFSECLQLSKKRYYIFELRSIKDILIMAGGQKQ